MKQYIVITVCDIIQNGNVLERDFFDEEYFDTREEAENFILCHKIGEIIGYHGDAEDILTDIYLKEES